MSQSKFFQLCWDGTSWVEPVLSEEAEGACSILCRPIVKSVYQKNNFLISQPKHMLWVLI